MQCAEALLTQPIFGFDSGRRRPGPAESRQPIEAVKGYETDFSLELSESNKALPAPSKSNN